jgi:glycosyltransferase involved in cell wall biosynthesis
MPKGWRLNLAGSGSKETISQLESQKGWTKVDYFGQVGPEEARDIILASKVGLVVLADTKSFRDSLPTKMFEYFASGLPVIASDFPLWREIISKNDCGVMVDPNSPSQVATAIQKYSEDPALLSRHSRNARNLAINKFNWKSEGKILVDIYQKIF